ncbi:isoquinoline 1-oxidoreductase protein [Candidatus Micropelagos thuwalensis]|uniref:Isoquinoline 1-oxidoreductase protein n=1 Tax=Candidatus Micropelagius thuwalensis TaxID=1397666 RepID=U2WSD5_9PROT|nr:tRNA (N(6)-L-threonylcarbamoyladenosine(37)-C(2))-methylthiotransferase MtaB [Candidatus Micropelagos thuwalensis]ERL46468.1 isoquinoline 1-oxidoreductase protein [Candidatus Micropelagos thuwalensis]
MRKNNDLTVRNFGCRLNALDGDHIRDAAHKAGLAQATIINSCAVTSEAVRQARQAVRKAAKTKPETPIIVTGCAAQTDGEALAAMPEVSKVLGNEEKFLPSSYASQYTQQDETVQVSDIMALTRAVPRLNVPQQNRARAFVQVQTGCDHRCTFCIIPFGRGNSRSTPIAEVVENCQTLIASGHREIVLTGVDITSWGGDLTDSENEGLGDLVSAILENTPTLERLRLSSVDAVELDAKLLDRVVRDKRVMPHLHLSLQAGDDMILKRMKRRHTREDAIAFCHEIKAKRPDMVFGADIIAGFPTETDEMFENSLKLVETCEIVWLHVFPFSPRPDTPAAKMPQLSGETIRERARLLREASDKVRQNWLETQIGSTLKGLIEKPGQARSETFAMIDFSNEEENNSPIGDIYNFEITGHDGSKLIGKRLA